MPKVSVIVPIYNVEKYLARCLDSVLNQTFQDFEIICVNDGSPDNCDKILEKYEQKDKHIKIITQKNQGLSIARNNGLKKSCGEYIYFLDSDDAIHPQLFEFALKTLQDNSADLFCFDFEKSDGVSFNPSLLEYKKIKYKVFNNPIFCGCQREKYRIHFNVWNKFYKKSLLDNLEFIPHIQFEDFPHTYAVLSKKPKTIICLEKLYFYTQRTTSISNEQDTVQRIKDFETGIDFVLRLYNNPTLKKELKFLKHTFIPNILKQQYNRCLRADNENRQKMLKEFTKELIDLKDRKMLSWRGHKLKRYCKYKKLIRGNNVIK